MAAGEEDNVRIRKSSKSLHNGRLKLLVGEKIEVRSLDEGFEGSWHPGTVIKQGKGSRLVKYENYLAENGNGHSTEWVSVSPIIDGLSFSHGYDLRGCIRPLPPRLEFTESSLVFGVCVDVFLLEAWWEGVVMDREYISGKRRIFFPDIGDEGICGIEFIRISQDWDEYNGTWQARGRWIFIELIQRLERERYIPVSLRQLWYDLREKERFKELVEWTCPMRTLWERLIVEVINDNLEILVNHCFDDMDPINLSPRETSSKHSSVESSSEIGSIDSLAVALVDNMSDSGRLNQDSDKEMKILVQPNGSRGITNGDFFLSPNSQQINEYNPKKTKIRQSQIWLEADVKPEYHPDAVNQYNPKCSKSATEFRNHLKYMGWSVEYLIDKKNGITRFRYSPPDSTHLKSHYFSLYKVFQELVGGDAIPYLESKTDPKCSQSSPNDESLSHLDLVQDNEDIDYYPTSTVVSPPDNVIHGDIVYPEAITEWSKIETKDSQKKDRESEDKKLKARKSLAAMGWDISFRNKGHRRILFYFSPGGKVYASLKQACIGCINEGYLKECSTSKMRTDSALELANVNSLVQSNGVPENQFQKLRGKRKRDLLDHTDRTLHRRDCSHSQPSYMLRSCKRVQQIKTPSSLHQFPRTILSWLIDNDVVLPRAKVYYHKKNDSRPLAGGKITRDGIKCNCCGKVYTITQFEVHAGSTYHRPSAHIFLEDGRSLLDCQVEANRKRDKRDSVNEPHGIQGAIENESECSVCHYGGDLILCDQCPSSFHKNCLGLEEVPDGDWFCPSCCCGFCGQNKLKESFTDNKCINCEQCERRFHVDCLRSRRAPSGYCGEKCEKISLALKELLGKSFLVGADNLTWTLRKSLESGSCDIETLTENQCKLSVALGVMHECFKRVRASNTQSDLTEDVIFNKRSELKRLNYKGFYTVLLEKNDELISTASVRIYGEKVAELPLVCTRHKYNRLGMCRILIKELEKKLIDIGVERLILPAVPTVLSMWKKSSFGFEEMTTSQRLQLLDYTFLDFQDTIKCHKHLGTRLLLESGPLHKNRYKLVYKRRYTDHPKQAEESETTKHLSCMFRFFFPFFQIGKKKPFSKFVRLYKKLKEFFFC